MSELTFTAQAGVSIRGQFRRAIKQYCFERGYTIYIDEDKGLLGSLFMITIDLPDAQEDTAYNEIYSWLNSLNAQPSSRSKHE